jgi:hypothetical protein
MPVNEKNHSLFSAKNLRKFEKTTREVIGKFKISSKLNWVSRDENLAGFVLDMF